MTGPTTGAVFAEFLVNKELRRSAGAFFTSLAPWRCSKTKTICILCSQVVAKRGQKYYALDDCPGLPWIPSATHFVAMDLK